MDRDKIAQRRAQLLEQLEAAKAKKREAEALLDQADRLVDSVDGAIQENAYWWSVATEQVEEAVATEQVQEAGAI